MLFNICYIDNELQIQSQRGTSSPYESVKYFPAHILPVPEKL